MKKVNVNGFSVQIANGNLLLGQESYGNVGTLLGVIEDNSDYYAVMENEQHLYYKKAVIDTTVEQQKKGPVISQSLFLGEENFLISPSVEDYIKESIKTTNDLNRIGNGEVNIDILLSQQTPTVYIGSDQLISYLHTLKKNNPSFPLIASLSLYPYQEKNKSL